MDQGATYLPQFIGDHGHSRRVDRQRYRLVIFGRINGGVRGAIDHQRWLDRSQQRARGGLIGQINLRQVYVVDGHLRR